MSACMYRFAGVVVESDLNFVFLRLLCSGEGVARGGVGDGGRTGMGLCGCGSAEWC